MQNSIVRRFKYFMNPFDGRFEDLTKGNVTQNVIKDLMAGLVVAMVAIPLAMGFAMASGLRPEQGIVGGAVAGLFGALFGGSKYQVYGPTAAFIPLIAGMMATYDHRFLVLVSFVASTMLVLSGLFQFGKIIEKVPHSIVVGFTIGIAVVIAFSQVGEIMGSTDKVAYGIINQLRFIAEKLSVANIYAVMIALVTFAMCKVFIKISPFIPGPLIGLGFGFVSAKTFWAGKGIILIKDKYGAIPTNFSVVTPPQLNFDLTGQVIFDIVYYASAIYIVCAIESLLCSRMADKLANNTGQTFNPNKELWGQGLVNFMTPFFNGFPHTGALARTSVNIKLGAVSPLAGVAKFTFKLLLAAFLASYLEQVPMACVGGILLYVATGMVKIKEIKEVMAMNKFHIALMIYTAIMVPVTSFMPAVLSAIVAYFVLGRFFDKNKAHQHDSFTQPDAN